MFNKIRKQMKFVIESPLHLQSIIKSHAFYSPLAHMLHSSRSQINKYSCEHSSEHN